MAHKKIVILQSCYIPWKGYFDLIAAADEFILYDDVQYTRQDWRNRNRIKTSQGVAWLTVPVKGNHLQRIRDTVIDGENWSQKHWKSLRQNYARAPYFEEVASWLAPLYEPGRFTHLSELNRALLEAVCRYLGITTPISWSWDYAAAGGQNERLIELCRQAGATEYISGPSARNYLDEALFRAAGIDVTWFSYEGYPEYPQAWGEFCHEVSILDLLFHCGTGAARYMKYPLKSGQLQAKNA